MIVILVKGVHLWKQTTTLSDVGARALSYVTHRYQSEHAVDLSEHARRGTHAMLHAQLHATVVIHYVHDRAGVRSRAAVWPCYVVRISFVLHQLDQRMVATSKLHILCNTKWSLLRRLAKSGQEWACAGKRMSVLTSSFASFDVECSKLLEISDTRQHW